MTFQPIPGGLWGLTWGLYDSGGTLTFSTTALNASTEKWAAIITAPRTGTLDLFECRLGGSVSTFPGNGLRLSFQDVDLSNGTPDGTVDQFRVVSSNPGANGWVVPGLITSDGTDSGSKRSVTAGDYLACVVDFNPTYTTGDLTVANAGGTAHALQFPYFARDTTGAYIKEASTNIPLIALKYDDGTYAAIPGVYPFKTHNAPLYNSGSTPDERGLIFQFPFAVKVAGAWFRSNIGGPCDLVLYDSDGSSVLTSASIDPDARGNTTGSTSYHGFAEQTLAAATNYRLVLKPTSGSNIILYDFDVNSAALLDAVLGQTFHYTERTDAGSWTQTTTKMPWMGLMVTAIQDEAGGGGGTGGAHILGGTIVR